MDELFGQMNEWKYTTFSEHHQMFIINHELVSEQYGSAVAIDVVQKFRSIFAWSNIWLWCFIFCWCVAVSFYIAFIQPNCLTRILVFILKTEPRYPLCYIIIIIYFVVIGLTSVQDIFCRYKSLGRIYHWNAHNKRNPVFSNTHHEHKAEQIVESFFGTKTFAAVI